MHTIFLTFLLVVASPDFELKEGFWFRTGDQPEWSTAELDLSEWHYVADGPARPPAGYVGPCWFRFKVKLLNPELLNTYSSLRWGSVGAAEFYINGKKVGHFGKVGRTAAEEIAVKDSSLPHPFQLPEPLLSAEGIGEYWLSVRYSNWFQQKNAYKGVESWLSVRPTLNNWDQGFRRYWDINFKYTSHFNAIIGACFTFAIIHLFLFLFYRKERMNVYFMMMAFSWGYQFASQNVAHEDLLAWSNSFRHFMFASVLMVISTIAFVHSLSPKGLQKTIWIFVVMGFVWVAYSWFFPLLALKYFNFLRLAMILELVRTAISSRQFFKRSEAWIIGIGAIPITLLSLYQPIASRFDSLPQVDGMGFLYGLMCIMLSMSIYIARHSARTKRDLERQLVEVQRLSQENLDHEVNRVRLQSENDRKSAELEAARSFQVSMLPLKKPKLADLEVAVFMSTASEVGGDYYDWQQHQDGSLTLAIGDATGHGLKAGTLVAGTKSVFNALSEQSDMQLFLQSVSTALKKMNLRMMFMAFALIKYEKGKLRIANAGMPMPLWYRARLNLVEEMVLKGPPLISMPKFPYQEVAIEPEPGDRLLFVSDGLVERFNQANEMFGEERLRTTFLETSRRGGDGDEQVAQIMAAGEDWSQGRAQDDDITLMLLTFGRAVQEGVKGEMPQNRAAG